jgi:hypothetical protein
MKKSILVVLLFAIMGLAPVWAQRGLITVHAQPTSDGELIGSTRNNTAERVNDGEEVARITSSFQEEKAAVLEFSLPPAGKGRVRKALLALCSHEKGLAPITVKIFAYWDEAADGVVNLNDWTRGGYLGDILVRGKTEISVLNRWPAFDVTEAVQKAMSEGAGTIGFFLRASDDSRAVERGLLRLRTAEFGMRFELYKPKMELYFE